ncbi:hypothetical protein [Flavihumibacter sp. UBA7668]|uniref:hypothetical protein n=1 Tax=Flavihumibacter sp. UBA7668 TaxID=1946542 RepID=UPI0025C389F7|nr:hypothetical protein [Flavihumibacter sp. UBA7668]
MKRGEDSSSKLVWSSWIRFNGSAVQAGWVKIGSTQFSPLIKELLEQRVTAISRNIFVMIGSMV